MNPQSILLNGKLYTHSQIIEGAITANSTFEKNTLSFCQQWLKGETHFQLTTSGSTGMPQKIRITRHQMIASAKNTASYLGLKSNFSALVCLDTRYIAGMMMLVRCFEVGMQPVIVEPAANPLESLTENQTIDFSAFVPYQLNQMITDDPDKLNRIKIALIGGAPVDVQLNEKIKSLTCTMYATYGMTETLSHVALKKLNGENPESYFKALPNISFETDERGCLVINANYLSSPVVTNDLVELYGDTRFNWIGRWDNLINTGGVKIVPETIEEEIKKVFNRLALDNRFIVVGIADKKLGQKVCLIIETHEALPLSGDHLRAMISDRVSKYEVPKEIFFIEKFIETGTGKINRKATSGLIPV